LYISTDVSTYEVLTGWKFPAAHGDSPEPYYNSPALCLEIFHSPILHHWRNVFICNYFIYLAGGWGPNWTFSRAK